MNFLPTIPRILSILAIAFVSLFALDSFDHGSISEQIQAFFDTYDPFMYTHDYSCNCLERRINL